MHKKAILFALLAGASFSLSAAPGGAPSSWSNEEAQWQQFKAKNAFSELDAEMGKMEARKATPTAAPATPTQAPAIRTEPTPTPTLTPTQPMAIQVVVEVKPSPQPRPIVPGNGVQEIIDCADICPQMVAIPPGRFLRGSPENEDGRRANEGPQQEVNIAYWLAISRLQVSREEWQRCVKDDACSRQSFSLRDHEMLLPAQSISWNEAQQYIAWLNKKTGKKYRLLSEAEWEYALRATSTTPYWWGKEFDKDKVKPYREDYRPVGYNPPNPWGLYDMLGRNPEWVQDCYHSNFVYDPIFKVTAPPFDGSAWEKNADCNYRVVKGAPAEFAAGAYRSAVRHGNYVSQSYANILDHHSISMSFRIARTLAQSEALMR